MHGQQNIKICIQRIYKSVYLLFLEIYVYNFVCGMKIRP